jgi:hypothetical protein
MEDAFCKKKNDAFLVVPYEFDQPRDVLDVLVDWSPHRPVLVVSTARNSKRILLAHVPPVSI